MNGWIRNVLCVAAAAVCIPIGARGAVTLLYTFDSTVAAQPYYAAPVVSEGVIYGVTGYGGFANNGVIFRIETDGDGFTVLHTFTAVAPDGGKPFGSMILSGSMLYGTTYAGGSSGNGTVFSVGVDGSGYTTLYSFSDAAGQGYKPYSSLTQVGDTLFGMTYYSGSGSGAIFSIQTNGTGYSTEYDFTGGASSGSKPMVGPLTLVGAFLYGMTPYGGASDSGVVFRVDADGANYTQLYSFNGGDADGARPYGSLIEVGGRLFGMTRYGGVSNAGVVFAMNADGSGYTALFDFTGEADSGSQPNGSLTYDGEYLYGTTRNGGDANFGVVFAIRPDGSGYTNLHSFAGTVDGATPTGDLALDNGTLYGWTSAGGANNKGTLFSLSAIPEPAAASLFALAGLGFLALRRRLGRPE